MSAVEGRQRYRAICLEALRHLVGAACAVISIIPRFTVVTMPLTSLGAAAAVGWPTRNQLTAPLRHLVVKAVLALCGYLIISAAISLDPRAGFGKLAELTALLLFAWLGFVSFAAMSDAERARLIDPIVRGTLIGAAFLAVELVTEQALTRFLFNTIPSFRPEEAKHIVIRDGSVESIAPYKLNRHLSLLVLMLWPFLLAARQLRSQSAKRAAWISMLLLLFVMALMTVHESSQIALVVGLVTFLAAWYWPVLVRWTLGGSLVLAFLLIVPAAKWAYQSAELHRAEWLPASGRQRIVIWGYTADQIGKNPLMGIGIRSTRVWNHRVSRDLEHDENELYDRRSGRHAHNLFLQTWFELGLIGVALVLTILLGFLHALSKVSRGVQPFAYGLFASYFAIQCFAWGVWQAWFLATAAFAGLLLWALALRDAASSGK